jgi:hypothetical protein
MRGSTEWESLDANGKAVSVPKASRLGRIVAVAARFDARFHGKRTDVILQKILF